MEERWYSLVSLRQEIVATRRNLKRLGESKIEVKNWDKGTDFNERNYRSMGSMASMARSKGVFQTLADLVPDDKLLMEDHLARSSLKQIVTELKDIRERTGKDRSFTPPHDNEDCKHYGDLLANTASSHMIHQWSTATNKPLSKLKDKVNIMGFDAKVLVRNNALAAMWKVCSKQAYARCKQLSIKSFEKLVSADTKISVGVNKTEGKAARVRDLVMKWSSFYEGKESALRYVKGDQIEIIKAQWMSALYKKLIYSVTRNKVEVNNLHDWFWETIKRYSRRHGAFLNEQEKPKDVNDMCIWADKLLKPVVSFCDSLDMINTAVNWLNTDIDNEDNWVGINKSNELYSLPERSHAHYDVESKIEIKESEATEDISDDFFSSLMLEVEQTVASGFAQAKEIKFSNKEEFFNMANGMQLDEIQIANIIKSVTMGFFSDYDSADAAGYVLNANTISKFFSQGVTHDDLITSEKDEETDKQESDLV